MQGSYGAGGGNRIPRFAHVIVCQTGRRGDRYQILEVLEPDEHLVEKTVEACRDTVKRSCSVTRPHRNEYSFSKYRQKRIRQAEEAWGRDNRAAQAGYTSAGG